MSEITWTPTTVKLGALVPWERNPRGMSKKAAARLLANWKDLGQWQTLAIGPSGEVYDGHQRLSALLRVYGREYEVQVLRASRALSDDERARIVFEGNTTAVGSLDFDLAVSFPAELLQSFGFDNDLLAEWNDQAANLRELLASEKPAPVEDAGAQVDRAEELQEKWGVALGDVWEIPSRTGSGAHLIVCGDCTDAAVVARVMGDDKAILLHADPPYGMGKEKDGIENDNLYRDKLDAFQMQWWRACRPQIADNGSVYIWGRPEDLWRLWYCGGLRDSERLTFRNEIVWDKGSGQGIGSDAHRMYPTASERCLFFVIGEQGWNNNADNYWEGFTPIVEYLESQRSAMNWSIKDTKRIAGHSEKSGCHWFDKSQWTMPTEEVYNAWKAAANNDAFRREYDDLRREYDDLRREWYATRAPFNNTHDNMTDVWRHDQLRGAERPEHPTPKPVTLVERIVMSSATDDGLTLDPFLGSGTTIVACEQLGRLGRGIEIAPAYVAVTLERLAGLGLEPRRLG